jgi:hypothetical protein
MNLDQDGGGANKPALFCLPTGKLQLLISDFKQILSVRDISSVTAKSLS